jgi:uncharacterized membrane protein YbhN (UPF0104 family)
MSSIETGDSSKPVLDSKFRNFIPYVLSGIALLIFTVYLWQNFDRYQQLLDFSYAELLALIGLALAFALINGSVNYYFFKAFDVYLSFHESFGLAAVNTLANQLPFAGGIIAKGVYLKKRHGLAYTHFLSATMALFVCFVASNGVLALIVLGYWALADGSRIPPALAVGFFGMVASVVALWLPINAISLPGKIGVLLEQLGKGWRVLSQNMPLLGAMTGFQILMTLLFAWRYWIAFHALSQDVTYTQCILFGAASVLTRLVNIVPGGLGVREGIVAGIASLLGFEAGISAVAVGLDRLVATSVIVVLGTIYTYVLSKKVTETTQNSLTIPGE